jgi:hypothetical protein
VVNNYAGPLHSREGAGRSEARGDPEARGRLRRDAGTSDLLLGRLREGLRVIEVSDLT